jgi:hypothetical protein
MKFLSPNLSRRQQAGRATITTRIVSKCSPRQLREKSVGNCTTLRVGFIALLALLLVLEDFKWT